MTAALGISLQADEEFLRLNRGLIEEQADIYEVNPETLWGEGARPNAFYPLFLDIKEQSGRPVLGHGILYSLGAATTPTRRALWRQALERDQDAFGYRWYSEHLGFADHGDRHVALPLPLPAGPETTDVVAENMAPLQAIFARVAFENNVGYFSLGDPLEELQLFRDVLQRTGCGMVLDLHNAFTTCLNFGIELDTWLREIDTSRVLEIHLSGGSESDPDWLPGRRAVRLDSHDGAVPEPVWNAFAGILPDCNALEAVIMEWMPEDMTEQDARIWLSDFQHARQILG